MTVDELANKIGKNRATVYRYENTDIESLPLSVLEPLAKALKTTPAFLMGWEKPAPPIVIVPDISGSMQGAAPSKFELLDEIDKAKLEAFADGLLSAEKYTDKKKNA